MCIRDSQSNMRLTDLRWETKSTYDVGMDLGFLDDRLKLTLEWYHSTTDDMLMRDVSIPSSTGFSKLAYRNVGKMRNLGWEFNITTNRIIKAGKFSADFNVAFGNNKNEILEMDATVLNMLNTKFTQENRNVLQRVQLNNPFGAIYGFRYKGVYQYDTYQPDKPDATAPVVRDANGNVVLDGSGDPIPMYFAYGTTNEYRFRGGDAIYEDINHDGTICLLYTSPSPRD